MKQLLPACGLALLAVSSAAQARGRPGGTQLTVSNVEVATSAADEFDLSNPFLTIKLDVLLSAPVRGEQTLTAETECRANGSVRVDTSNLIADLSDLAVGETKHAEASAFARSRLGAPPSQCTIRIRQNTEYGRARDVAQLCFAAGHVTQGACK